MMMLGNQFTATAVGEKFVNCLRWPMLMCTCLVEMEEHCAKLTSNLSKETKRANQEKAHAEQELARSEQGRAAVLFAKSRPSAQETRPSAQTGRPVAPRRRKPRRKTGGELLTPGGRNSKGHLNCRIGSDYSEFVPMTRWVAICF